MTIEVHGQQLPAGYTIEPASCSVGYHVRHNGRIERQDRKPRTFATPDLAEDYIRQQVAVAITPTEYQQAALRTLYPDLTDKERLGLCGLGLAGELGEVVDMLKKFLYHRNGKPLDMNKLKDELGDVLWYYFILLDTVGLTFEEVMQANVTKLETRHANGFNPRYASDSHESE